MVESTARWGPFADDVRAIAAHHGVASEDVVRAPAQGQVNLTVFLGPELVLRLPRKIAAAALLAKEAEVIPLVLSAGVPTAGLVSYDASLQVATVPYLVLDRLRGTTLAERGADPATRRRALQALGEILVALHRIRSSTIGSGALTIPAPFDFAPATLVGDLQEAGEIGRAQAEWILERFELLHPQGPPLHDPVLVHRDVIESNLILGEDEQVTALLDWGCAEWGSPARDLVGLPVRDLPDLLSGYRPALAAGAAGDRAYGAGLERDALWYHLYLGLARLLKRPSTSEDRNWAAPRQATLIDLFAFVSQDAWPTLAVDSPAVATRDVDPTDESPQPDR